MSNLLSNIPYELFSYIGGGIFLFIILYKFFPNLFIKIHKPIFFTIGILSLSLGYVGIVIPGLPTTVFILIAAWAFSKCSEKLHFGLKPQNFWSNHFKIGKHIEVYQEGTKKLAITMIIQLLYLLFTLFFTFY